MTRFRGNEILTPAEMYRADALALAAGIAEDTLIDNAGRAVATEIVRRYGARQTVVLCGPGNNGKDGKVAARYLRQWGWPAEVSDDIGNAELIIDALYGAGLNRDFPKHLADRINGAGVPIVAIDVPSGLDGLTGHPRGACIKADLTITFARKKPAHVLLPGRSLCGEVVVADIGFGDAAIEKLDVRLFENARPQLPSLELETHKYRRGHALIWSGGELNSGAARLAALAAARVGAGLTSLCGSSAALRVHAVHLSSIMLKPADNAGDLRGLLQDKRMTAFCIGPGAGVSERLQGNVLLGLRSGMATVLDADALTAFSDDPGSLFKAIKSRPERPCVMTPHDGEFSRLFNEISSSSQNKVEKARAAAVRTGAILVLKGADTVIAHPDGRAVVNTNAPAKLATAGSGDVLAGMITGLLAQVMEGMDGFAAACAGVWLHGDAASRHSARSVIAEDLIAAITA